MNLRFVCWSLTFHSYSLQHKKQMLVILYQKQSNWYHQISEWKTIQTPGFLFQNYNRVYITRPYYWKYTQIIQCPSNHKDRADNHTTPTKNQFFIKTTNQIVIFAPPDSSTLLWHCNITGHITILLVLQEHQKTYQTRSKALLH